jgi:arylsulfatase
VAVAVGALICSATRPAPEPLAAGTDLTALFGDFGCENCNVLLITIDTLRADHLPCQGYPKNTAPNICAFGERNLLFKNAVSGAPSTVPALITMMSGSIVANDDPLELLAYSEGLTYLADRLKARGYITGGFTDHHAIRKDVKGIKRSKYLLQGFETFVNVGRGRGARTSTELNEPLLEWITQHQRDKFFVWAHYFDPHWNYMPPPGLARRFGFDERECGEITNGIDIKQVRKIEKALTNDEVACLIALHQGEIFHTDHHIGQVLDRLDNLGLEQNTLVIITADHGEEFLERDRLGHEWTVYDELMHVPLMIRNPRRFVSGRLSANISTMSIYDIVLGAVDGQPIELPAAVVGRAYHYYGKGATDLTKIKRRPNEFAMYHERMKVIITPQSNRHQLFDLAADPGERNDLGVRAARRSPLHARLVRWLEEHHVDPGQASPEALEAQRELLERLQQLGYTTEE